MTLQNPARPASSVDPKSLKAPSPPNGKTASGNTKLLTDLWRSPERVHQIGVLDRQSHQFRNIPVKNVDEAVEKAFAESDAGADVYFACAEYLTSASRVATNAYGASAFWVDLDCGDDKAADGKGYRTVEEAENALRDFCANADLPRPTHSVNSGGGLHAYWMLDCSIERATWQDYAKKFKALTKAFNLLADPTRTADIASVLRIPGTLNHKYNPPKPVTLQYSATTFIERESMFHAIDRAFDTSGKTPLEQSANQSSGRGNVTMLAKASSDTATPNYGAPNIDKIASALVVLDPDCDEATWKMSRLAPLARAAKEYPECRDALYQLAKSWSSGELRGKPSKAWSTPGKGNGLTGQEAFEQVWARFITDSYTGKPTTLGTIFHDATEAGWVDSTKAEVTDLTLQLKERNAERFAKLDSTQIVPAVPTVPQPSAKLTSRDPLATIQQQFALINVEGKLWVIDRDRLTSQSDQDTVHKVSFSSRLDGRLLITRAVRAQFPKADASNTSGEFFDHPATTCYRGVEFNPVGTTENFLNVWVGPTIMPEAGDWMPIQLFLREVICNGDEASYQFLIRFIAHALQRPEEKPGILIILLGGQGTGKGTFGRIFRLIWSTTFLPIHNIQEVTGSFNAALERAFIVFMDEALFVGDRRASDALKSLVTEPVIQINEKYQPTRQTRSYHRFIAATNADHFKNTERDDRRDFVLRLSEDRKGDHAYWQALNRSIDNGGVAAMVHDLLKMDLSEFNVRNKPNTPALLEQKLQSLDSISRWWYDCLCSGHIMSDDNDWPEFVSTVDVIEKVYDMAGGKLFRKPAAIDVVQAMKKLCPSAIQKQQQTDLGRHRGLALPPLEQARTEFEQYIGGSINW